MPRIYFLVFLSLCSSIGHGQLKRFSFTENKMASPLTIIMYTEDSIKAKSVSDRCFAKVDSLISIFSDYISDSELNRLCAKAGSGIPIKCSPALFEILQMSKEAYEKSNGAFDITVGPLSRLWREAGRQNKFPDSASVKEKLRLVGFSKIQLDPLMHTAILSPQGMQLDLGGIAQGYIAQRVIDFIKSQKIENALVDVSGDIVCIGKPPQTNGWTVGVNVPRSESEVLSKQLMLTNAAVTTSGDTFRYFEYQGKRYSHVIDPSSGYGITTQRNVTVIAKEGTKADWLTKACSLLSIPEAKKLAQKMDAAVLIVERKKTKMIIHTSKKFRHFWKNSNHR